MKKNYKTPVVDVTTVFTEETIANSSATFQIGEGSNVPKAEDWTGEIIVKNLEF